MWILLIDLDCVPCSYPKSLHTGSWRMPPREGSCRYHLAVCLRKSDSSEMFAIILRGNGSQLVRTTQCFQRLQRRSCIKCSYLRRQVGLLKTPGYRIWYCFDGRLTPFLPLPFQNLWVGTTSISKPFTCRRTVGHYKDIFVFVQVFSSLC